ncbi:MAG: hypothetical protein ACLFVB_08180 [Thermoplasmata archaeon]
MSNERYCPSCGIKTDKMFCPECGSLTSDSPPEKSYNITGTTDEMIEEMFNQLNVGDKIPKTDGGTRPVTRISKENIYMKVGVQSDAEKYIDKEMIAFALGKINEDDGFRSSDLESEFPTKFSQGSCVFSMTGGLLKYFGIAGMREEDDAFVYFRK